MAFEQIKKIAINFSAALIVALIFSSVAPGTAHKAYAFFGDLTGTADPTIGDFTAAPDKDGTTATVAYSIRGNFDDIRKVLIYHKQEIPPQLGEPDKDGIYSYTAADATKLYYRYKAGSKNVLPQLGSPNADGVYTYQASAATTNPSPIYYKFDGKAWQWTPYYPVWMPATTTTVNNPYNTKDGRHGEQPSKKNIDIINYLNQNNPSPSAIKDVLPQLGSPVADGVYVYKASDTMTQIHYKFDGKAWQWTPYYPVWMPATTTTLNNPYNTKDWWNSNQPTKENVDIINYLAKYDPAAISSPWEWSPDKKNWMETSTTKVSFGDWKDRELAKENRDIISYLEDSKPNPKSTGEVYTDKPSLTSNKVAVDLLGKGKGKISQKVGISYDGWHRFTIELYVSNGDVPSKDVVIRTGVPIELGEPDDKGVYTYQAPDETQIWYRQLGGKWQWTMYEPKEYIWMPATTTVMDSPGKKYHGKQPGKVNIGIINYLAKYNPESSRTAKATAEELNLALNKGLAVSVYGERSIGLSWKLDVDSERIKKGSYVISHFYKRWERGETSDNPKTLIEKSTIKGTETSLITKPGLPAGRHYFEVKVFSEPDGKGELITTVEATTGFFDDAYIETYKGGVEGDCLYGNDPSYGKCDVDLAKRLSIRANRDPCSDRSSVCAAAVEAYEKAKKLGMITTKGCDYDRRIDEGLTKDCTPEEVDIIWKYFLEDPRAESFSRFAGEYNCELTKLIGGGSPKLVYAERVCKVKRQVLMTLNRRSWIDLRGHKGWEANV